LWARDLPLLPSGTVVAALRRPVSVKMPTTNGWVQSETNQTEMSKIVYHILTQVKGNFFKLINRLTV
jgi:hypothetical protein